MSTQSTFALSLVPVEVWRPVPGYEFYYAVSDQGRIARTMGRFGQSIFLLKSTRIGWSGYPTCHLWIAKKHCAFLVHRLVAETFVERHSPECVEVNHKDGNKSNCAATNLEWVTRSQNIQHAYDTGLRIPTPVMGEKHHFARLRESDVRQIKDLLGSCTDVQLAERFHVRRGTIDHIRMGRTWKSVVV